MCLRLCLGAAVAAFAYCGGAQQEKLLGIGLPGDGSIIVLPGEDEGGGLIDIDLGLPLPILGPDQFEPDNTPRLAVWTVLQNLLEVLLPKRDTHNLHVAGDEDWTKFQAERGSLVTVETLNVRSKADTFLTVYRLAEEGEPLPTETPEGCGAPWLEGPEGERLFYVGCNDDAGGEGSQAKRSLLEFVAPESGIYFARVTLSSKAAGSKGLLGDSGETTYNFQASAKGVFASTVFCTLLDNQTGDPIAGANVVLQPIGAEAQEHDAVYAVEGVMQGSYTLVASAAGYDSTQENVVVGQQGGSAVTVYLQPDAEGEPDGGPAAETPAFDYALPEGQITLEEVLRAVQLFNARTYHCDAANDDKYAPFPGSLQCAPHPLDYKVQDWTIDLSELLRMLQLFSMGSFSPCEDGEAGACL